MSTTQPTAHRPPDREPPGEMGNGPGALGRTPGPPQHSQPHNTSAQGEPAMTAQQPNQYQPAPQTPAAQTEPKHRKLTRIAKSRWAIGGAAFLLGAAIFGGNSGQPASNTTPTPTATRTVTVEKVKASPDCTDALTKAETVMSTANDGFQIAAKILDSASRLDAAGVKAGNGELAALSPVMRADRAAYDTAAAKCRAAS